jgi:glycopeptide antibiotics resistance protein
MIVIPFFPYPFFVGLLIVALVGVLSHKSGWGYVFGLTVFGFYTLALISAMFFPFRVPEGWPASVSREEITYTLTNSLNLIPFNFSRLFTDAALGRVSYRMVFWQTAGNILITIPFGLGTGFLTKLRGWRILLVALGTGFSLEGMQFIFILLGVGNAHVIDINDLLLNALGVLVGYGLYLAIRRVVSKVRPIRSVSLNHP